jgi:Rax2 C-terminal beta propeller domain
MPPLRLFLARSLLLPTLALGSSLPRSSAQGVHYRSPAVSLAHVDELSAIAPNCQPQWLPTFGGAAGTGGPVSCFTTFDDGSGPALYVGGQFQDAGGVPASRVAKWDGEHWSALGSGLTGDWNAEVNALCVFDDGGGPALYVAGYFTTAGGAPAASIAKWDGSQWSALGAGLDNRVYALAVFDDGSGPALFAGGSFNFAGGQLALRVAKWDGTNWSAVGSGASSTVSDLRVFDDGSGRALYATGGFTLSYGGGNGIARWDGSQWSAVGNSTSAGTGKLCVFDDGTGPALYASSYRSPAASGWQRRVAKWDGANWSPVGLRMNGDVLALAVCDDGSGPALYAGGYFTRADTLPASRIARWNGQQWTALPVEVSAGSVYALGTYDDGTGPSLLACGGYSVVLPSGRAIGGIGRFDGTHWLPCGNSWTFGVRAATVFDDGSGSALYVSFPPDTTGQHGALRKWDGASWSAVPGAPTMGTIYAFAAFDDGTGPALFVGGWFTSAGGAPARGIARWNGSTWSEPGGGIPLGTVASLLVHDDGGGPALYAGGGFTAAGGVPANGIAKWNGSSWSPLGSGLTTPGAVLALATYDDGGGPALYAAGNFLNAGGTWTTHVAKWDGSTWSALGNGVGVGFVNALCVYDDGSGPGLYVGGYFGFGSAPVGNSIARWNGSSWSPLGSGVTSGLSHGDVNALSVFDSGQGRRLILAGRFDTADGTAVANIASWDGIQASSVGSGFSSDVRFLQVWDDGGGPALYAGGAFRSCIDSGDSCLAKWGKLPGCGYSGAVVCEPGVGGVSACPCSNPPSGAGRGCDNSSATGGAALDAVGHSSLANDTLVFTTSGETPSALSIVLQGTVLDASGFVFGQGVRCLTGALLRLYVESASGGSMSAPGAGDAHVSARSAQLGDMIAPGSQRHYGVYYRDPLVLGGCPALSTFNITQQLSVLWQP